MAQPIYCERWHDAERRPVGSLQPPSARGRHNARVPYCLLAEHPGGAGSCVLEMRFAESYCQALFLDGAGRICRRHVFVEAADDRLFLREVSTHHYREAGAAGWPPHSETMTFSPDGGVVLTQYRYHLVNTNRGRLDVSRNYLPRPRFESVATLLLFDRYQNS